MTTCLCSSRPTSLPGLSCGHGSKKLLPSALLTRQAWQSGFSRTPKSFGALGERAKPGLPISTNPLVIASTADGRKQSRDHSTGSNESLATLASFSRRNRFRSFHELISCAVSEEAYLAC